MTHNIKTEHTDWLHSDVVCSCGFRKTVYVLDHSNAEEVYYFIRAVYATHLREVGAPIPMGTLP